MVFAWFRAGPPKPLCSAALAAAAFVLIACAQPPSPRAAAAAAALPVRRPPPPAAGRLLVARAGLSDPRFERTVVLLIEADEKGAWGLVVNRPTELEVGRVFPAAEAFRGRADVLHYGGPVDGRKVLALVRTGAAPEDSVPVLPGVRLAGSLVVIDGLARQGFPCRVFAGYAGWGPGQLEAEIARGDWQLAEGDEALLFDRDGVLLWELLTRRSGTLVARAGERGVADAQGRRLT